MCTASNKIIIIKVFLKRCMSIGDILINNLHFIYLKLTLGISIQLITCCFFLACEENMAPTLLFLCVCVCVCLCVEYEL